MSDPYVYPEIDAEIEECERLEEQARTQEALEAEQEDAEPGHGYWEAGDY